MKKSVRPKTQDARRRMGVWGCGGVGDFSPIRLYAHTPTHWSWVLGLLILLAACGGAEIKPVDIAADDMCAFCKMAISEKQYAAEFIDQDGEPYKFDDIGCMVRYIEDNQNKAAIATYYVVDFESREWVKGEEAYYVRSVKFKTPMSGGIVAFRDKSGADAAVANYQGEPLRFSDLVRQPPLGDRGVEQQ